MRNNLRAKGTQDEATEAEGRQAPQRAAAQQGGPPPKQQGGKEIPQG